MRRRLACSFARSARRSWIRTHEWLFHSMKRVSQAWARSREASDFPPGRTLFAPQGKNGKPLPGGSRSAKMRCALCQDIRPHLVRLATPVIAWMVAMSVRLSALVLICVAFAALAPASLRPTPASAAINVPVLPSGHCRPYICRPFGVRSIGRRWYCQWTKPSPVAGRLTGKPYCRCTMTYQPCT
jgi:hypothetical protein